MAKDPTESYDVAKTNPACIREILSDVKNEIATFPPDVQTAFQALQKGAAPRPDTHTPLPAWAWEPEDRR